MRKAWRFLVRYWQGLEDITITFHFSRNKTEPHPWFQRTHYALYRDASGNVVQTGPERATAEEAQTDMRHWREEHQDDE
jgi:hypothetical protein